MLHYKIYIIELHYKIYEINERKFSIFQALKIGEMVASCQPTSLDVHEDKVFNVQCVS